MRQSPTDHQYRDHSGDRRMRVGDSERDAIANLLREHHLAGRLGTEEFQARLDRCFAAKTYGDLDELIADLPREEPTRRAGSTWRWPAAALLPLLIAAVVLSRGHLLWLAVPLFFFAGRPLFWRHSGRRFGWPGMCYGGHRSGSEGTYV